MTEEQKEILIAKMLDAPSSLSDVELDSILHDDELRDIYEASAALSSACIRQPEWDMKAEWNSFRPRIRRKPPQCVGSCVWLPFSWECFSHQIS